MMNLNERISKIIDYSNLSASEFADEIEVQRSSISHITSGRNKPSLDFLIKVKDRFPELKWEWLIKGDGEMLEKPKTEEENAHDERKNTASSLPDLFALIGDEDFGFTESEDRISKPTLPESSVSFPTPEKEKISDSQRLEKKETETVSESIENHNDKIKRIVLFYESGKFESFEP